MVALFFFGFYPQPLLDVSNPTIDSLMEHVGVNDDEPAVPPGSVDPDDPLREEGGH